jgi:hypothetical protein
MGKIGIREKHPGSATLRGNLEHTKLQGGHVPCPISTKNAMPNSLLQPKKQHKLDSLLCGKFQLQAFGNKNCKSLAASRTPIPMHRILF